MKEEKGKRRGMVIPSPRTLSSLSQSDYLPLFLNDLHFSIVSLSLPEGFSPRPCDQEFPPLKLSDPSKAGSTCLSADISSSSLIAPLFLSDWPSDAQIKIKSPQICQFSSLSAGPYGSNHPCSLPQLDSPPSSIWFPLTNFPYSPFMENLDSHDLPARPPAFPKAAIHHSRTLISLKLALTSSLPIPNSLPVSPGSASNLSRTLILYHHLMMIGNNNSSSLSNPNRVGHSLNTIGDLLVVRIPQNFASRCSGRVLSHQIFKSMGGFSLKQLTPVNDVCPF